MSETADQQDMPQVRDEERADAEEARQAQLAQEAQRRPRIKPAPLEIDPEDRHGDSEGFFNLESIDDPSELLDRSTQLTNAFRAAVDQALEFQATAAAQLADAMATPERIAEQAGWSADYAGKMIEYGRLIQGGPGHPVTQE